MSALDAYIQRDLRPALSASIGGLRTGLNATEPALHFQDCISLHQDSINCK